MAPILIDPDYVWNYSFCEWIDLGVEIDEDWYSMGNIKYEHSTTYKAINGWDEIVQEPIEHDEGDSTDGR
jgi:hypothetical protein